MRQSEYERELKDFHDGMIGPPRTKITADQMRIILTAVEHGFREGERGKNLQGALASVHEMYEVAT